MSILLVSKTKNMHPLKEKMSEIDPNLDIEVWPNVKHENKILFAVAWNHPDQVLGKYKNLKAVASVGAGVDHLINDPSIPPDVTLCRTVISSLKEQIFDYIESFLLDIIRNRFFYFRKQLQAEWKVIPNHLRSDFTTGIMGLGELGAFCAEKLASHGWKVCGWSKSKKSIDGVDTFTGNSLDKFLNRTNILACLLPLTPETGDILSLDLFKKLKQPAYLIHAGRGEQLVEEDLLYAIDMDIIKTAVIDVFRKEPLPDSHPFWSRNQIIITPHVASLTDNSEAAQQLVENFKRLVSGKELLHTVNRDKGY